MLQSYVYQNKWSAAIAATKFDVVACAETKVTGRRHVSELPLPGFKAPALLLRGARPNGLDMALFVRSGLSVSRREKFECSCCEFMVAKIPGRTPPNSVRISPPSHLHPPTHLHLHATAGVSQCILAHCNTDIYLSHLFFNA